jgi:hypothetical protein
VSSPITARARRLQQEQRALRHDLIEWMGRPQVFWVLFGLSAVLSLVLNALPDWISGLIVIALFAGIWRAGISALQRRNNPT